MRNTKRDAYYSALIILLVSIVVLVGISLYFSFSKPFSLKQRDEGIEYIIGVSQSSLIEPWQIIMGEEIRAEAAKYSNLKVIYTDAAASSEKQKKDIDSLLEYGIDLLIVSPSDPSEVSGKVSEVYEQLPVIVLDRAVEGYDYTLYIGPDNYLVGQLAGELALELLGEDGGYIVEIKGLSTSAPTFQRSDGFRSVISQNPNIKLISTIEGAWLRDTAEDKTYDVLGQFPVIDVIFSHNDAMSYGAYLAKERSGCKNPIYFIGVDGLPGAIGGLELVYNGKFAGTFVCPTGGKEAVQYAMDILNGRSGIPKKIILRSDRVTKENVDVYRTPPAEPPTEPTKKITLGFCSVGKEGGWRDANTQSIKDAAKEADIELLFVEADLNQQKQIDILSDFIEKQVDVIAFTPVVETGWEEILQRAKEAGIPVILSDRSIEISDRSLYTTFLGSDIQEEGRRAARWVVSEFGTKDPVNVVTILGVDGSTSAKDRKIGFDEIMQTTPNYTITASASGDWSYGSGKRIMEEFLHSEITQNNRKIDVVYAHNDEMALGAIEAIEQFGLQPGEDIKLVSTDAIKEAVRAMQKGTLNCTVECSPFLGRHLMKSAQDIVEGKTPPLKILVEESVFTREEFSREWLKREY